MTWPGDPAKPCAQEQISCLYEASLPHPPCVCSRDKSCGMVHSFASVPPQLAHTLDHKLGMDHISPTHSPNRGQHARSRILNACPSILHCATNHSACLQRSSGVRAWH